MQVHPQPSKKKKKSPSSLVQGLPLRVSKRCAKQSRKRQKGFSFLEIMIVIVIMASIAALVGPMLFSKLDDAKIDQAKIQMKSFRQALDLYQLDNSSFPTSDQGLEALLNKPTRGQIPLNWKGPYLRAKTLPLDPWNRPYLYRSNGSNQSIQSLGADGKAGGEGRDADILLE